MTSTSAAARKAELRAVARRLGAADRTAAASEAIRRLVALPEFSRAATIAFYCAIGDEVPVEDAAAFARSRGARTVYPVRTDSGLELATVDGGDSLPSGPGDIREPAAAAPRVCCADVVAFVVPGLLFDRSCRRLGRGGGQYDRLLKQAPANATSIGICYADHMIEALPEEPWDVAMDLVVTDQFVVRRALRGGRR